MPEIEQWVGDEKQTRPDWDYSTWSLSFFVADDQNPECALGLKEEGPFKAPGRAVMDPPPRVTDAFVGGRHVRSTDECGESKSSTFHGRCIIE